VWFGGWWLGSTCKWVIRRIGVLLCRRSCWCVNVLIGWLVGWWVGGCVSGWVCEWLGV
jgi:hypothetical protein